MDKLHWEGMLAMVIKIVEKCQDKEEALRELYDLVPKEHKEPVTAAARGPWEEEALRGLYDLVRKEPAGKDK